MTVALWEQLEFRFKTRGEARALRIHDGNTATYADMLSLVTERAELLSEQIQQHRVRSRVAICAQDAGNVLYTLLACWKLGNIPLVIREQTPDSAAREIAAAAGARVLVTDSESHLIQGSASTTAPSDSEALLLTTSGTTGVPKIVALPDTSPPRNLAAISTDLQLTHDDIVLVAQPLSHVYGLLGGALAGLWAGAVVHAFPASTPAPALLQHAREFDVTVVQGAPSFWRFLLAFWSGSPLSSVRIWTTASEAPGKHLVDQIGELLPRARGLMGYGMTEAGPRVSHIDARDPAVEDGCIGEPFPHIEWRIDNPDHSGVGRLALRGDSLFSGYIRGDGGYYGYASDGWFVSTDLVALGPDGRLYHRGRDDYRIKVGGHLINPAVTEQLLLALPNVADAACFSEAHPIMGHVLKAEVVAASGVELRARELLSACRATLEPALVPRSIRVVDELVRTQGGKRARVAGDY